MTDDSPRRPETIDDRGIRFELWDQVPADLPPVTGEDTHPEGAPSSLAPDIVLIETPAPDPHRAMIEFFRARLDEQYSAAARTNDVEYDRHVIMSTFYGAFEHALLHTPSKARRDVTADRELLRRYEEAITYYGSNVHAPAGELHGLRTAVALRVSTYSGTPGYDPAWGV